MRVLHIVLKSYFFKKIFGIEILFSFLCDDNSNNNLKKQLPIEKSLLQF